MVLLIIIMCKHVQRGVISRKANLTSKSLAILAIFMPKMRYALERKSAIARL